jgi:hypothetical protein
MPLAHNWSSEEERTFLKLKQRIETAKREVAAGTTETASTIPTKSANRKPRESSAILTTSDPLF